MPAMKISDVYFDNNLNLVGDNFGYVNLMFKVYEINEDEPFRVDDEAFDTRFVSVIARRIPGEIPQNINPNDLTPVSREIFVPLEVEEDFFPVQQLEELPGDFKEVRNTTRLVQGAGNRRNNKYQKKVVSKNFKIKKTKNKKSKKYSK